MTDYNKWKRKNVVYRGISSDSTLDVANGSGARFGRGLYFNSRLPWVFEDLTGFLISLSGFSVNLRYSPSANLACLP
jgi:hypothetical protein